MGTSEETGMEDVRYFVTNHPALDLSIVPDTGFPVCCTQRGSMSPSLEIPFASAVTFQHSNKPSVTPEEIIAVFSDGRALQAKGKSAHIFTADGISNAVGNMLHLLADECPAEQGKLLAPADLIIFWHGESLDIAFEDEISGALQVAATGINWQDGKLQVKLWKEILFAIQNMIADTSGLICDGAKSSCALKIASSPAIAIQCAQLGIAGVTAPKLDGIIAEDAEISTHNLANLGSTDIPNNMEIWQDYPAKTINWACYIEDMALTKGKEFFGGRCVLGGFDNRPQGVLYAGSKEEVIAETYKLMAEAGKQGVS